MKLYYGNILKDDKYVQNRFEKYYSLIKNLLESNRPISILDVGGYTADMLTFLRIKKVNIKMIDYLVIDADKEALNIAKKKEPKFSSRICMTKMHYQRLTRNTI